MSINQAQPYTAFQQGVQDRQQNRLGQMKMENLGLEQNKLRREAEDYGKPTPYKSLDDAMNDMKEGAGYYLSQYDALVAQGTQPADALAQIQPGFAQARQFVIAKGVDPAVIPEMFDPEGSRAWLSQGQKPSRPGALTKGVGPGGQPGFFKQTDKGLEKVEGATPIPSAGREEKAIFPNKGDVAMAARFLAETDIDWEDTPTAESPVTIDFATRVKKLLTKNPRMVPSEARRQALEEIKKDVKWNKDWGWSKGQEYKPGEWSITPVE